MITMDVILILITVSCIGVVGAMIFSLIPGLHVYSILGFIVLALFSTKGIEPIVFSSLVVSLLIGYALGSCISAVYFQTPDDSSVFMVFPSQKYLEDSRGYEAVYLTGYGAIIGVVISIVLIIFFGDFLANLVDLLAEHSLWIIATAMTFVWMSEWPKDPARQKTKIGRLGAAWLQLGMGLFTIIASGILGIFLFFSQLVAPERSFQGLAAAFVGLFAFPSLIQNMFSSKKIPKQYLGKSLEGMTGELVQGAAAGVIGGGIGMLVPSLTAGVGNTFARHAVAQGGDRSFMFSQGLSRSVYYVGAVLLLFIPGVTIRRGGGAMFITMFYVPSTMGDLLIVSAVALIAAGFGWMVFSGLTNILTKTIHKIRARYISIFGAIFMLILTYEMLGLPGLLIMSVSTAIGAIPLVFNTRRIHCIGVITIPIMISMAGLTAVVTTMFGIA